MLYDRIDDETFKQKLDKADWNALLGSLNDVDEMCNTFTETLVRIARECIPTKFVTVRNNDKPWFTSALRTEIRHRDRFRKIVLKSKTESSILRYKQQRNKVNNLKRNAKENSEKNLDTIIENVSNSKEYWKLMKMLIKSNKPSYNLPPLNNIVDDIEANIVYDDNGKCDLFNKYFSCISGIDDENVLLLDFESRTGSSISDILCTEEEIFDVITNLAVNKASGPDIISHKMLQVSPEEIAVPLPIMFSKSLEQCKYPKLWKKANVIPIFKKGNNSYPSIRVITKLPNSEQSYKGKVKTHNYINRQNQSTTGKL